VEWIKYGFVLFFCVFIFIGALYPLWKDMEQ